ncbi:hypothetical protein LTR56_017823 [Elasticomyces elasticus]|nr:hypothetical protein LTR22_022024 [Elasticomyces elasticus]KAK3629810.1 hypothetical protein LTR56_017823 [Elasticomyces elasticus]KAK4917504.1 hypothetical protein LTR49_014590 [Elasticomyces elasticus]KAK5756372.1 hypothetical protein LTS12_013561 [Elasticomyces elasticus]
MGKKTNAAGSASKHGLQAAEVRATTQGSVASIAAQNNHESLAPFSCPTYPYTSKATPPTCPETCLTCLDHYLPESFRLPNLRELMDMHSDEEAEITVRGYVERTRTNLELVRQHIESHGDAMLKRWRRRGVDKRAVMVRKVLPDAYPQTFAPARMHYELQRLIRVGTSARKDAEHEAKMAAYYQKSRTAYLLPWCDVQTLTEDPGSLLALLQSRTQYDPAEWVAFDHEQLKLSFARLLKVPCYNPHAVIMYGKHFGRLIPWNESSAHREDIIGYPKGVLILEAQHLLSQFLCKMVEMLLAEGIEGATKGALQWRLVAETDFQLQRTIGAVSRRSGAFQPPPRYDLEQILQLLKQRHEEMFEEVLFMQSDPLFLRLRLRQIQNSAYLDKLVEGRRQHCTLTLLMTHVMWALLFTTAIAQVEFVLRIQKRYKDDIRPGKSLPAEYACALVLLETHFKIMHTGQVQDLFALSRMTRTFQDQHTYTSEGGVHLETTREELLRTQPLLWAIIELHMETKVDERGYTLGTTACLAFIDSLMAGHTGQSNVVMDDQLATHLSNMMVVNDIRSAIQHHMPRPDIKSDDEVLQRLEKEQPGGHNQLSVFKEVYIEKGYASYADACPAVTLVSLRHTEEVQEHLDPEFCRIERLLSEYEGDQARAIKATAQPTEELQFLWEADIKSDTFIPERKQKIKTRRTNNNTSSPNNTIEQQLSALSIEPSRPRLAVKLDSKIIFDRMFTATTGLGDINWTAFVAAMIDAGCSVIPNGGSLFTFSIAKDDSKASIVMHRPHPDPTIDPVMLKTFGKRLRGRFEWDADTFVEREKGSA